MRFLLDLLRDPGLLRRAWGAFIVFALVSAWNRYRVEQMESDGTYKTSTYDGAESLMQIFAFFAVATLVYIAVCLLVSPRENLPSESTQTKR